MNEPSVCCMMLANGRPEMVRRALRCYHAQTYRAKELIMWDTGDSQSCEDYGKGIWHCCAPGAGDSVGALRNAAAGWIEYRFRPKYIAHWDSDDYSHPERLAEQVALAENGGFAAVAYNRMLFWDTTRNGGEAWMYFSPPHGLGTSMLYRVDAWARTPFRDLKRPDGSLIGGEDTEWLRATRSVRLESSMVLSADGHLAGFVPRMIASIHGANTSSRINGADEWKRVPKWDRYCKETMKL